MKTFRVTIISIAILAVVALVGWIWYVENQTSERDYDTQAARIRSITEMVELCTSDIHEEVPVKDSVNGKWIVARQVIEGRIRFDIDTLRTEQRGDTLVVFLPPERVDILENAGPKGYEVLDSWDSKSIFFDRTLTAAEENKIKRRWQEKARKRIYDRGYVRRARKEAVDVLTPLLRAMHGDPATNGVIIVVDPTPDGTL